MELDYSEHIDVQPAGLACNMHHNNQQTEHMSPLGFSFSPVKTFNTFSPIVLFDCVLAGQLA